MSIGPPKCKTCGKTEWGHVCSGLQVALDKLAQRRLDGMKHLVISETGEKPKRAVRTARKPTERSTSPAETVQPPRAEKPKADRNTYLREYMRDKRAADKLGITVAEYRKKSKPEGKV